MRVTKASHTTFFLAILKFFQSWAVFPSDVTCLPSQLWAVFPSVVSCLPSQSWAVFPSVVSSLPSQSRAVFPPSWAVFPPVVSCLPSQLWAVFPSGVSCLPSQSWAVFPRSCELSSLPVVSCLPSQLWVVFPPSPSPPEAPNLKKYPMSYLPAHPDWFLCLTCKGGHHRIQELQCTKCEEKHGKLEKRPAEHTALHFVCL